MFSVLVKIAEKIVPDVKTKAAFHKDNNKPPTYTTD